MKISYLIGAVAVTIVILIIAFQNIAINTSFWMFFDVKNLPMTIPILFLSVFGVIAGALYTLFLQSVIAKKREDDREESEGDF